MGDIGRVEPRKDERARSDERDADFIGLKGGVPGGRIGLDLADEFFSRRSGGSF